MSDANVEVVRRWVDAYNRRDFDELTALCDPEIEIRSYFVAIERVFRGHEGIHEYFEGLDEAYDRFQLSRSSSSTQARQWCSPDRPNGAARRAALEERQRSCRPFG